MHAQMLKYFNKYWPFIRSFDLHVHVIIIITDDLVFKRLIG